MRLLKCHLAIVLLVPFLLAIPTQAAADRDPTEAFLAMAAAGSAYINNSGDCPGVIAAPTLYSNLEFYTVIDIRAPFAYEAGHIPGAFPSSLGTLIDDLASTIPSDKPYVIACYSGQTAGLAKIAMELLGYDDVKSLLFGMSAWNPTLDVWTNNCADNLPAAETENQNGNLTEHAFPVLEGDPATIVADRVAQMLAAGFRGVSFASIQDNLEEYFIINYFGEADYLGLGSSGVPGHIPGAYQFTPFASLGLDQMLNNIPTDMPVVVYAWTGQHSAQVASYLNMLGYDAYSLKYGVNNLFHSELTAHVWGPWAMYDFPLEEGGVSAVQNQVTSPVTSLGNHPNPFNPMTTISYQLNEPARVTLGIYDLKGRLVTRLVSNTEQTSGSYEFVWRGVNSAGRGAPSGAYIYRLEAGDHSEVRRLMLVR